MSDDEVREVLKPCICPTTLNPEAHERNGNADRRWQVVCWACDARGPLCTSMEIAIATWNALRAPATARGSAEVNCKPIIQPNHNENDWADEAGKRCAMLAAARTSGASSGMKTWSQVEPEFTAIIRSHAPSVDKVEAERRAALVVAAWKADCGLTNTEGEFAERVESELEARIAAEIQRVSAGDGWLPIESAPKDGGDSVEVAKRNLL